MIRLGRPTIPETPCPVSGCDRTKKTKPYCNLHYRRFRTTGDPLGLLRMGVEPKAKGKCAVPQCSRQEDFSGYCKAHYRRNLQYGDPLGGGTPVGAPMAWLKENCSHKGVDCLIWPFSERNGYHTVKTKDGYSKAHRIMCALAHGDAKSGHFALHSCGNKSCVNPNHLRWGTPKENTEDAIRHGSFHFGESVHSSKITEKDVRDIRNRWELGETARNISKNYPLTPGGVWSVAVRKVWRHVE